MSTKDTKVREELRFDVRLVEHLKRVGKLDPKEFEAHLKHLPDDEERGEYIAVFEEPTATDAASDTETLTFT